MKKIVIIPEENIVPLKVLAAKANVSVYKYISDVLDKHVKENKD